MFKGFKEFIMRGNVIDLAVAVVIGAAFTAVVTALIENLFNPIIGALFNADSLTNTAIITIGNAELKFGAVLAAIISFLLVAVVVYFVFVLPINTMKEHAEARRNAGIEDESAPETELDILNDIRKLLAERSEGRHSSL